MLYFTYIFHVIPKYYGKCIRGKVAKVYVRQICHPYYFLIAFVGLRILNIWIYLISIREALCIYYSPGDLKNQNQCDK